MITVRTTEYVHNLRRQQPCSWQAEVDEPATCALCAVALVHPADGTERWSLWINAEDR